MLAVVIALHLKVLSYCFTTRATKEDLQRKSTHSDTLTRSNKLLKYGNGRKSKKSKTRVGWQGGRNNKTKTAWRSCPTMHCFTTAPFRKLVFQKGTEPSCTSKRALLVKGKKGSGAPVAPVVAASSSILLSFLPPLPTLWTGFLFFSFFFPTKMEKKERETHWDV